MLLPGRVKRRGFDFVPCLPPVACERQPIRNYRSDLARKIHTRTRSTLSYRFLFIPGTIGAITWLARNRDKTRRIRQGLVLTGIGDKGRFHYKRSRQGDADIDRAMAHVLDHFTDSPEILDLSPYGYDERQYCSPGFNLAVGCLMRSIGTPFLSIILRPII